MTTEQADLIRRIAREIHADPSDDDIEVDDNAEVHESSDDGYWVAAWVYVRKSDSTEIAPG